MFNLFVSIHKMKRLRRIASHETILENGTRQTLSVIEIQEGKVVSCYPLTEELPQTEWMAGQIVLRRDDDGILRAYHNNRIII